LSDRREECATSDIPHSRQRPCCASTPCGAARGLPANGPNEPPPVHHSITKTSAPIQEALTSQRVRDFEARIHDLEVGRASLDDQLNVSRLRLEAQLNGSRQQLAEVTERLKTTQKELEQSRAAAEEAKERAGLKPYGYNVIPSSCSDLKSFRRPFGIRLEMGTRG
jgi:hypothetical protein